MGGSWKALEAGVGRDALEEYEDATAIARPVVTFEVDSQKDGCREAGPLCIIPRTDRASRPLFVPTLIILILSGGSTRLVGVGLGSIIAEPLPSCLHHAVGPVASGGTTQWAQRRAKSSTQWVPAASGKGGPRGSPPRKMSVQNS
ncbi:hypothetical protein B0H17DRAFT_1147221 [Mycena rosella]|uniref:Uncharacterized protein n=1 Tax=Mycena rosella TaxID=1033263 RepID=A0AAD7CMA0_MYCRO|nr:hypothetical protein B0H17DRAFT_1147221 [Mycena rosella]